MAINAYDCVIIGGGWTGLLLADMALERGWKVLLLEKENRLGGLATTKKLGSFYYDLGGHRIYFKNSKNFEYLRPLASEWTSHERKSMIHMKGGYIDYPPTFGSLKKMYKIPLFKILIEFLKFGRAHESRGENEDFSLKQWILNFYGPTLYELYFKDYSEKIWGRPCEELSSLWAEQRIGRLSRSGFLMELFGKQPQNKENSKFFQYPVGGMGKLVDSLKERILKKGGVIAPCAKIVKTCVTERQISSLVYQCGGQNKEEINPGVVIHTAPLNDLDCILPGELELSLDSNAFQYRNTVLVALLLKKNNVTPYHWIYFPEKGNLLSRVYEPKNWDSQMGSEDETLLCCEIICDNSDPCFRYPPGDVSKKVIRELESLQLIQASDVLNFKVTRVRRSYPVHPLGIEKKLDKLFWRLERYKNFFLAGRQGKHAYFDMEECFEDALTTIQQIEKRKSS